MRICIIASSYKEDAWMISAKQTAEALESHGKQEVVVITSNVGNYPKYEFINGVHVYRLKTKFIPDPFNYAIVPGIFRWVWKRRKDFDIFIVNKYMFFTSLATPFLRLLGKKIIVQTDTFPGVNWKHPTSKKLNFFMWLYARTLGKLVLKTANKVIVLHELNEEVCKKWGLNYKVIHSGVDYKKFAKAKPAKDINSLRGPVEAGDMIVTWVGRLDEIKGFRFFLDLAKEIGRVYGRIHWVMICGNKYPQTREKLRKEYPNVHFYGFREDIPEIYRASDLNILTSYDEGLPNTIMEAMASGLPVIATNVGGVPMLVEHGVTGYVITCHDIEITKEYVLGMLEKPEARKNMGKAGQEKIRKLYDFKNIATNWLDCFKEVLKK